MSLRSIIGRSIGRSPNAGLPAPFIVGFGHSGSTLLRLMLDAHPKMTIPPETNFLPDLIKGWDEHGSVDGVMELLTTHRRWGDFNLDADELRARLAETTPLDPTNAIRCFFDLYAEKQGKPRWGDKSPRYALAMPLIKRTLPEARFIHLIRDGRDVALSALKGRDPSPEKVEVTARRWKRRLARTRKASEKVPYIEVRYEDLLTDTEAQLRKICEFSGLEWDPVVLRYHERAEDRLQEMGDALPPQDPERAKGTEERRRSRRMRRHALASKPPDPDRIAVWRRRMDPASLAAFEGIAGEQLAELGYELGGEAPGG
jgi:hypothetical protein